VAAVAALKVRGIACPPANSVKAAAGGNFAESAP